MADTSQAVALASGQSGKPRYGLIKRQRIKPAQALLEKIQKEANHVEGVLMKMKQQTNEQIMENCKWSSKVALMCSDSFVIAI